MQSDDVKEILARLEPTLAHIDSELARQSDEDTRLSGELARQSSEFTRQSNMLSRIDERTKLAPTHGGVIGLIPETMPALSLLARSWRTSSTSLERLYAIGVTAA